MPKGPSEPLRVGFRQEMDELRADVIRLGAMTSETIGRGTAALLDRDLHAAQELIDGDDIIDDYCIGLEEQCCRMLALQSPLAGDLRFLLTTLRLISELERSADLMVNVCKASRRIYDVEFVPQIRGLIEQMGIEAAFLIRTAIDAYVDADTSLAAAMDDIDDRLDDLQVAFMQSIFQSHSDTNLNLQSAVQMAMIGRYYERIGDHAVNIGERVLYMVTGWLPEKTGSARQRLREAEALSSDSATDTHLGDPRVDLAAIEGLMPRLHEDPPVDSDERGDDATEGPPDQ